jgi:lysophospholipase L1-like esterase
LHRLRDAGISIAIAFGVLAAIEAGLRLAGYRHDVAPMTLRFGYPNPREIVDVFRPDPDLFWRMRPGSTFDAEAPVPINALGYRGPVPTTSPSDGPKRVVVMGDSVAFGASTSFPELLAQQLGSRFEVLNFGVPGYTIVQGLRQFESDVAKLKPDVVIIAYGWNDHWLAKGGLPDEDRRPARAKPSPLLRLRLVQGMWAVIGAAAPKENVLDAPARVPLLSYRSNLDAFIAKVQALGAKPIVVALPSGLADGDFPEYLIASGFTRSATEAIADHRAYADTARQAALHSLVDFVDLQPSFERPDGVVPGLLRADKIHMTDAGNARIAGTLRDYLIER